MFLEFCCYLSNNNNIDHKLSSTRLLDHSYGVARKDDTDRRIAAEGQTHLSSKIQLPITIA